MRKIGFIGAQDKTEILINIAKILTVLNQRVIIVDGTVTQKARYVVPNIQPTKTYLTTHENIDIAVGFESIEHLESYFGVSITKEERYDIVFFDVDTPEAFENFSMHDSEMNFFVTAFDTYNLRKGLEILTSATISVDLVKVLFVKKIFKEDEIYLNFLAQNYPVNWHGETIYYAYSESDEYALADNEKTAKIKFKNLSQQYKEGLATIISRLYPNYKVNDLLRLMKNIDKGV